MFRSKQTRSSSVAPRSAVESLEPRLCLSTNSTGIALADVTGDGIRDLITTRSGKNGGLNVRVGNGDGTYGHQFFPAGYSFARGAAVDIADFDANGHIDIVVMGGKNGYNGGPNGGLYVLLNSGNNVFTTSFVGGNEFIGKGSVNDGGSYNDTSLAVGLADADANVDIIVNDPNVAFRGRHKAYRPETYILTGNGDGTFNTAVAIA